MRIQRVVDIIRDGCQLLVQSTLEDAVLLELADRAPHDVSDGGSDQAEMKFQFKSKKKKPVWPVSHHHKPVTLKHFETIELTFINFFRILFTQWFRMNQQAI